MRKPKEFEDWPANIEPGFGPFRAVVMHVTDGDTVDVLVDQAFNTYGYITIRIANIDAPELYTADPVEREKGRAARSYLESIAPVGTRCLLRTDRDKQTFGRYVGSATLENGVDLASQMVEAGHATYSDWS